MDPVPTMLGVSVYVTVLPVMLPVLLRLIVAAPDGGGGVVPET